MVDIHQSWNRDFDVYDRVRELKIDLGTKETALPPSGFPICGVTFTPSGLVFLSGAGGGTGAVTNDDDDVKTGNAAGREAGIKHVAALHWALDSYGTLNDVWYCVKCIGMVNSHGGASFSKSPEVVNGYSKVFHDVFGGPLSEFAKNGADSSQSGWHARSAVGGFDLPGHCMIEPEMIVQIDPELALCIIKERGPCV